MTVATNNGADACGAKTARFRDVMPKEKAAEWGVTSEARGKFMNIPKGELRVDHTYQRTKIRASRVSYMAREWSWFAFIALLVVRRPDGTYWVVDGQHRKLAADKRDDVDTLPCMVFEANDVATEAAAFVAANTQRTIVTPFHKFRANLVAGDPTATGINAMVERSGYKITGSGGSDREACCIDTLLRCFSHSPSETQKVWTVVAEVSNPGPVNGRLLEALYYLEGHLARTHHGSIGDVAILSKLKTAGVKSLLGFMNNAALYHARGGPKIYAEGILKFLNRKRSSRRIPSIIDGQGVEL